MTDIQLFDFQGSQIRIIDQQGEPWFVAADVCNYFGVTNRNRVMQEVYEEDKGGTQIETPGGNQMVTAINESGLYTLLFNLKPTMARGITQEEIDKKEAILRKFKKWVTSEVLPSIRKHGAYMTELTTERLVENPDLLIELATNLKLEREKRKKAEELADRNQEIITIQGRAMIEVQPKVRYYQEVLAGEDGIGINVIAKELGMSAVTLNRKLNEKKVIYKQGGTWLLYHRYQEMGYTKTRTYSFTGTDGEPRTNIQTLWTQKGREFIHNMIKGKLN